MICTWITVCKMKEKKKILSKTIQTGCYRAHQIFANYGMMWALCCGMLYGVKYYVWIFEHSNMWNSNDAMDFRGNIYYYSYLHMHVSMRTIKMALEFFRSKKKKHTYLSLSGTQTKNSKIFYKNDEKKFESTFQLCWFPLCVRLFMGLWATASNFVFCSYVSGLCIELRFIKISFC